MTFELPSLPYASDALAPYMSSETLDFHHGKHHQTYVTNLNNLVKDTDMQDSSLEEIVVKSSKDPSMAGIFNNAGQHWNHILFWQCMKPNGGGSMPSELESRITSDLGGIDQFKEAFIKLELHNLVLDGLGLLLIMANWLSPNHLMLLTPWLMG